MNSLKNKNVLVTGGAGFIGSHLVDRIIKENPNQIHVVDNFFLGKEENLDDAKAARTDLEIFRLDASDLAAMRDLVEEKKIDVVFNLAVIPLPTSLKYPVWTVNVNIGIALTFCELARTNSIETRRCGMYNRSTGVSPCHSNERVRDTCTDGDKD